MIVIIVMSAMKISDHCLNYKLHTFLNLIIDEKNIFIYLDILFKNYTNNSYIHIAFVEKIFSRIFSRFLRKFLIRMYIFCTYIVRETKIKIFLISSIIEKNYLSI